MAVAMITVIHHRPVGAFMTALSRMNEADRPTTVEGFMKLLAGYLNKNFLDSQNPPDVTIRSPNLSPAIATVAGEAKATFTPDKDGDKSAAAIGTWMVHPYIQIAHVQYDAKLELRNHSPSNILIRLPEATLLATSEDEAHVLSVAGDTDKFTGPSYYYNYFGQRADMTTMEYLWSRIADYTTSHCR